MADPLDPEARALWQRVAESVRPFKGRKPAAGPRVTAAKAAPIALAPVPVPPKPVPKPIARATPPANTLDGGWDRKLKRGLAAPDATIDLHGHTLSGAHAALEDGLARAVAMQARLVLLVTGRPPPPGRSRLDNPLRGVIRASIADWLHHSRHAGAIAAVRAAHPRHGGAGALYVVLRRGR